MKDITVTPAAEVESPDMFQQGERISFFLIVTIIAGCS